MAIRFFEENIKANLKDKRALKQFISQEINAVYDVKKIDVSYVFCDDEKLLERNIAFLNHDTLTDILTFDLSNDEDEFTAEIYISIDRVKDNAKDFNVTYNNELHRVIFHGLLHLLGYDDKTKDKKAEMRKMEDQFLQKYFSQKN